MASISFIRYEELSDPINSSTSNTCSESPILTLNLDTDGFLGKLGKIIFIQPNVNNRLISVFTKANTHVNTYGEQLINNKLVVNNDIVWLSSQLNPNDNGIYQVSDFDWTFLTSISETTIIDLGASAFDPINKIDISRNIIVDTHGLDLNKIGMYSITYYIMNSMGILVSKKRKIVVKQDLASISPVGGYRTIEYNIAMDDIR